MEIVFYIIASVLSGIIAGMGMGGGTFLIPVLTIFFSIQQQTAQGINLLAFLPTAVVSLIIHFKNKLVDLKVGTMIVCTGVVFSILGSLLATNLKSRVLQICFGVFLLIVGTMQTIFTIKNMVTKKSKSKKQQSKYKVVIGTNIDLYDWFFLFTCDILISRRVIW